jgi:hypothetical protein
LTQDILKFWADMSARTPIGRYGNYPGYWDSGGLPTIPDLSGSAGKNFQ